MVSAVLEHSLILVLGGIIFGVSLYYILPTHVATPKMIGIIVFAVTLLFWAAFLLPRAIIFSDILTIDALTYIGISTFSYLVFLTGFVISFMLMRLADDAPR